MVHIGKLWKTHKWLRMAYNGLEWLGTVWNGLEWFGAFDKGDQIAQYGHSACTSHFHDSSKKGTCVGLLMLYPNLPSIYIACSRKTKFEMITS